MFLTIAQNPLGSTLSGQLGDPTAAYCRVDLPPVVPPVAVWTKVETLAGVFSGLTQTWEGLQAGLNSSFSNLWTSTVVPLRGLASGTTGIIVWSWENHSCWMSSRDGPLCFRVTPLHTHTRTHTHQWGKGGGTVISIHALRNSFILPITSKWHHICRYWVCFSKLTF